MDAVDVAFEAAEHGECLGDFSRRHCAEVTNMILETFDEKEYIDMVREKGHEAGQRESRESGLREGRESGKIQTLLHLVRDGLLGVSVAAECAGMSVAEFERLLAER